MTTRRLAVGVIPGKGFGDSGQALFADSSADGSGQAQFEHSVIGIVYG